MKRRRRRQRRRLVLLVSAVAAGLALLTGAVLQETMTYYRTPSELDGVSPGERVRLGGAVVPGTMRPSGERGVAFDLADDAARVSVRSEAAPPRMFSEGGDAVLEGSLGRDGVFLADRLLAKHGTSYRAEDADDSAEESAAP